MLRFVLAIFLALVCSSQAALSTADKQLAVDTHNQDRSMEGASNMLQMAWDPVLAGVAQAYAEQCIFGHNAYRSSQYTAAAAPNTVASYVGENLYVTSAGESAGLIASAIQDWYAEKSNYNFATGGCGGSGVCGHYTQIVWAQSYLVGCGSSYCQSVAGFGSGTIIVCDYAPGGNYVGQAPYTKGTPCSMCPAMWTKCYNSLCSMNSTQITTPSTSTSRASSSSNPSTSASGASNSSNPATSASVQQETHQALHFVIITFSILLVTK